MTPRRQMQDAIIIFVARNSRAPTYDELAVSLAWTRSKVDHALRTVPTPARRALNPAEPTCKALICALERLGGERSPKEIAAAARVKRTVAVARLREMDRGGVAVKRVAPGLYAIARAA